MKIDQLRTTIHVNDGSNNDDDDDDGINCKITNKKSTSIIKAGGIDGGFRSEQDLLDILQPLA